MSFLRNHHRITTYKKLYEGVSELQKYFPKLDLKTLKDLVALDPTYKGGEELGKYGKWIIKLFYNDLKNIENKKQYALLLKQYPDGINPKTGQKFQAPVNLPSISSEDLYKVKDSLKQYDLLKKEIGKPLDAFKTLPDLDTAISQVKSVGVPENETALKRYNLFKKAQTKGLRVIYEDNKWIVGIPETKESSCMFGSDTRWCTTSSGQDYYERYTKDGNLFINLNKETGELFQFHFESSSFMDENDKEIDMEEYSEENSKMVDFYQNFMNRQIEIMKNRTDYQAEQILNDKNRLQTFFEYLRDITVKDDFIYGKYDITDIPRNSGYTDYYIYDDNPRNAVSLKFIEKVILRDDDDMFSNDYDLYFNEMSYSFNKLPEMKELKELGVSFDDLYNIDVDNYYGNSLSDEQVSKIDDVLQNGVNDNDYNPIDIYKNATRYGSLSECYNDISNELKDNLPLNDENPFTDGVLNIKYPVEDIKNTLDLIEEAKDEVRLQFSGLWFNQYNISHYINEDEYNWLYKWREIHFSNPTFSIYEPNYGWEGFDEEYWKEEMQPIMEEIIKIVKSDNSDVDKQIDEVLNLAKFQ